MAKKNQTEVADAMGVDLGPSLYLSDKNYDGIKNLKIGEEVTFTITGKVVSVSEDQYSNEKSCHASIRIKKINNKSALRHDSSEYDDD